MDRRMISMRDFIGFTMGQHIASSLSRILYGYVLAASVAVPLGLLAGWFRPLETYLSPWIEMIWPYFLATFPLIRKPEFDS